MFRVKFPVEQGLGVRLGQPCGLLWLHMRGGTPVRSRRYVMCFEFHSCFLLLLALLPLATWYSKRVVQLLTGGASIKRKYGNLVSS